MSWTVQLDGGEPLEFYEYTEVSAFVTGFLLGCDLPLARAKAVGASAQDAIKAYNRQRDRDWKTLPVRWLYPMDDEQVVTTITVGTTELAEDPSKRCDGFTGEGNPCGRSLNHRREC